MRNVFDQYQQAENRVTHALLSALAENRKLLRAFVREFASVSPPDVRRLAVVEQGLPGEQEVSEEEAKGRGLPDGWIHAGESPWGLLIESKVTAPVDVVQLRRHLSTAERRGFRDATVLLITTTPTKVRLPPRVCPVTWTDVYAWLRVRSSESRWAARAAEYLEVAERQLVERETSFEGALTRFDGFHFGPDHPYSYAEAKRVLGLAMGELRKRSDLRRELGTDPSGSGRPRITGRETSSVWDFLPLAKARGNSFAAWPHLTLSLSAERLHAHATIPNGLDGLPRKRLRALPFDEFANLLSSIEKRLRPWTRSNPGSAPWFLSMQRHYQGRSSAPVIDAELSFDLRTAMGGRSSVKGQPAWIRAAYEALQVRRGNYQMTIGLVLPHARCTSLGDARILDTVAGTWIACQPLLDVVFGRLR